MRQTRDIGELERMARLLRAPYLSLETPSSLPIGAEQVDGLREFASMAPEGVRVGLEARAHAGGPLPTLLHRTMEDLGLVDVTDLSRAKPRVNDETVYTRLFGEGQDNVYEFDDDELRGLDRGGRDATSVAYAFHGVRMYKDAARFLTFRRTGTFPPATDALGLASLAAVLAPDARFPAHRDALVRNHGWKVIDLSADRRVHAEVLLCRLPAETYENLRRVLQALKSVGALTVGQVEPSPAQV